MSALTSTEPINISAPAIVQWHHRSLDANFFGSAFPHPVFHAVLDRRKLQASLKLQLLMSVKGCRNKVKVYLLVSPEHVQRLNLGRNEIPEAVLKGFVKSNTCASADSIVRLHLSLKQPPVILGPPDSGVLQPKSASSGRLLDALWSLVRAESISFHVPSTGIPLRHLESLCEDLNSGTCHLLDGDVESLYSGKGAKVIEHQGSAADSPPSYDELALSSPPPRLSSCPSPQRARASHGKKRRRSSDAAKFRNTHGGALSEERLDGLSKQIQEVAEHVGTDKPDGFAAQISSLRDQFSSMEERILKKVEDNLTQKFEARLAETKDLFLQHVEERLDEVRGEMENDWHDRLDDTKDEMDEALHAKLDDRLLDVKEELRDCVKEELETVEDNIRSDLRYAL